MKKKSNLGNIIFSLAELHTSSHDGRFNALFDAIDGLSKWLEN